MFNTQPPPSSPTAIWEVKVSKLYSSMCRQWQPLWFIQCWSLHIWLLLLAVGLICLFICFEFWHNFNFMNFYTFIFWDVKIVSFWQSNYWLEKINFLPLFRVLNSPASLLNVIGSRQRSGASVMHEGRKYYAMKLYAVAGKRWARHATTSIITTRRLISSSAVDNASGVWGRLQYSQYDHRQV